MLQAIKGMNDILPGEVALWQTIEETARAICEAYGYQEIRTPVLEKTELFARGVGESTDIVEKEMYSFVDRGGDNLSLRPEGTAGVVRALIEHKMHAADPEVRVYYIGPMYRRERPQKGRYRQFHQIGVEAFGIAAPEVDAELMAMLYQFLREIGLPDVVLDVNTLGDQSDRPRYLEALRAHFEQHRSELCEDCLRRIERAPLRLLDCKSERCHAVALAAPLVLDHLGPASREHFDGVRRALDRLQVPHRVNPRVVRGLDYYTRTVFEAVSTGLGSQNAICGGGRYDNLVEQLGGPALPAIGYAQGIERLVMLVADKLALRAPTAVALVPVASEQRAQALEIAALLRGRRIRCILDLAGRSVKAQLRRANRANAAFAVVLGEEEIRRGQVEIKPLVEGESAEQVAIASLVDRLTARCAERAAG
ncbi:MAG: histidine--tRNA ligase [Deltaproteobacteria bacterium]|nr:histidine--tRNA ligase [Deltaproteobacteria bacterium]